MINRKEFTAEMQLREHVRQAIKIVAKRRDQRQIQLNEEEKQLRNIVRNLIKEGTPVASNAKHNNTGINALEDLLKNTNVLSVLETGYKSLTTAKEQRESYRNHILAAVKRSLAPEESRKEGGADITEDIDIEIGDPKDDPDFIDVEATEKSDDEVAKDEFALATEDKTGRNRAFTDFQNIEKVILTAFDDLDNPEDLVLFEEYLIKNLSLYFDKFESELETNVEPPAEAAEAEANVEAGIEGAAAAEEVDDDVANIELQEVIKHLNIEDIIENLL
tara:strand:+ start:6656 stop:7483 length:828 start_codon:yes stop_codon:yes gene_type:complete